MPAGGWTRRGFLGLLVLGGGALVGAALWRRASRPEPPPPPAGWLEPLDVWPAEGERYRGLLLESSQAARISEEFGRLYLEQRGGVAPDLTTLAAEVMARLEAVRPWRRLGGLSAPADLEERLAEAIAADFASDGGLCTIDGWQLAETECRLAAMRYLADS